MHHSPPPPPAAGVQTPTLDTHTRPDSVIDERWPSFSWWERVSMNAHAHKWLTTRDTAWPHTSQLPLWLCVAQLSFSQPVLICSRFEFIPKTFSMFSFMCLASSDTSHLFVLLALPCWSQPFLCKCMSLLRSVFWWRKHRHTVTLDQKQLEYEKETVSVLLMHALRNLRVLKLPD